METDVNYPQSTDQVDIRIDGLAGGIMDMIDGTTDPNHAGVVTPTDEAPKTEQETEAPEPSEQPDNTEKFAIKWQGQTKEVTKEELINLAQQGFDYKTKTQALARERDEIAPYVGLANRLKSDPVLAQQVASLLTGQPITAPLPAPQKVSDDPIEQLKWEIKQEIIRETQQNIQNTIIPLQRQQLLDRVRIQVQADPDYAEVQGRILNMVKSQPPSIQRTLYLQLDQDPQAYLEVYNSIKQQIGATRSQQQGATMPEPVRRETKAPILESGGVSPPQEIENKEKAHRISKQKAKALRSGDNMEIAAWLLDSGAIDHLL